MNPSDYSDLDADVIDVPPRKPSRLGRLRWIIPAFFVALIARALRPGSQVDTVWCFEAPQGTFKSRSLRELGGAHHAEISAAIGTTAGLPRLAEKRILRPCLVSSISVAPRSPTRRE